jgi:integrase
MMTKGNASPLALKYAACAKRMFFDLRAAMATDKDNGKETSGFNSAKLVELAREAKQRIQLANLEEQHQDELTEQRRQHLRELEIVKLRAENDALQRFLATFQPMQASSPSAGRDGLLEAAGASLAPVSNASGSAVAPHPMHRLSEVIPVWRRLKNPAVSTVEVYEAAIKRFERRFPNLHVETIEKRHVREYINWLQNEGLSGKTIAKEHGAVRALLAIAEHEEWISSNPASGILLPEVKSKKVRSYTPEECKKIFSSPVFCEGARPTGCKGDAAYWMPLLLLFTGARREEISQITTDRVRTMEGVHYLAIDPIDDEGRLKTDESKRAIPIHDELLRLGFINFVEQQRNAGSKQLFRELKPNKRGQYGAKWGDWWGRYVRGTVGITDELISPAHSFRHLFITECRRLSFREDYERALVGHIKGSKKDAHDGYGEHLVPSLAAELNRIDFRKLDLSHLQQQ